MKGSSFKRRGELRKFTEFAPLEGMGVKPGEWV
jgi:hypothetical protein